MNNNTNSEEKLNGLDLFSGYGGITLALEEWVSPIAYCEIDRYAQSILLSRMSDNEIPKAPIWDDITTFSGDRIDRQVDIIYGGFPCQDISVAGAGAGLAGKRSGLFFEVCRLVEEVKPSFVFLENVPAIRTRGLREVIRALTDLGYDCRWTCVSASEVGAPHLRKRWFLLAHTNSAGLQEKRSKQQTTRVEQRMFSTYTDSTALERQWEKSSGIKSKLENISDSCWWTIEPDVGRVVNGTPFRVDRIKALGNGVVPAQAREAFKRLIAK